MTTTSTILRTSDDVRLCWAFVVEGAPICATTWPSSNDMTTVAWTGTDQASLLWYTTLDIIGRIEQRIQLFDPKVEWDTLEFRIVDTAEDALAATVCREAHSTANKTWLTADLTNSATSMSVQSTTGFATSGTLYVGSESILYTGKTSTTFTGLTRGYLSLFTANGGARFSDQHYLSTDGAAFAPEVWDQPRTWYNRRCALYMHFIDPDTGKPCAKANARLTWAGRLKGAPRDNGDGSFTFTAWSIREQLNRTLMDEQFTAALTDGTWLLSAWTTVQVNTSKTTLSPVAYNERNVATATLFAASGQRTVADIVDALNTQFNTWVAASSVWPDRLQIVQAANADGEQRWMVQARVPDSTNGYTCDVRMDNAIWTLLGWSAPATFGPETKRLARKGAGSLLFESMADGPPNAYVGRIYPLVSLATTNAHGTWIDQPTMPPGIDAVLDVETGTTYTATGFLQVGSGIYAVSHSAGTFRIVKDLSVHLGTATAFVPVTLISESAPEVKQVWLEYGSVGELMLRLACSTGTSGYNHASYDSHPRSFGAAIPFSLLDPWGWYFLGASAHWLILTKPTPLLEELESALQIRGAYLVWREGKLTIRRLAEPAAGAADWDLTEENKANSAGDDPDRTMIERSAQGLVNRVTLDYNADMTGAFRSHITVNNNASISDFGAARPVVFKGRGVYRNGFIGPSLGGVGEWLSTAASLVAQFGRPAAIGRRSVDISLCEMVPTDTIALTDNYVVSPLLGTRGVSDWPAYVLEQSFDFARGACRGEVVFGLSPETTPDRLAVWAPSAEVSSSTVTTAQLVLTCAAHKYSLASEAADASHFAAYSAIVVAEISPTNPAAPTLYSLTVASQTGDTITCTTDPTSGAGLDTTKLWTVQFDDIVNAIAAQKTKAFIADDYDTTTGDASYTHYRWMGPVLSLGASTTKDYQQVYRKLADYEDNKGEPLSCRLAADTAHAITSLYGYKTSQQYLGEMFSTERTHSTTTRKILWGPEWIDLPAGNARDLTIWLLCKTSAGTGTLRVVASVAPVTGSSDTALTYADGGAKYVEVTTTATSLGWKSSTMTDPWRTADGCWLTIEGSATTNDTVTLAAVSIYEAHL